jgi:hypothetical protein
LEFTPFYPYFIHPVASRKGIVQNPSGSQTFDFGANKSSAFARLDVLEFYNGKDVIAELDTHSVANVRSCCHRAKKL